jgi:aspartyl-tRNA(Asn)/glutamyl-tRNA(Gln) amidotransferase subunit C
MAVGIENVRAVSRLARLEFSPEEEERLTGELNRILEYMEKLNQLDTDHVEPTAHVVPIVGAGREDEVDPFPGPSSLLALAPQREGGYFKVPRIID